MIISNKEKKRILISKMLSAKKRKIVFMIELFKGFTKVIKF